MPTDGPRVAPRKRRIGRVVEVGIEMIEALPAAPNLEQRPRDHAGKARSPGLASWHFRRRAIVRTLQCVAFFGLEYISPQGCPRCCRGRTAQPPVPARRRSWYPDNIDPATSL